MRNYNVFHSLDLKYDISGHPHLRDDRKPSLSELLFCPIQWNESNSFPWLLTG